MHQLATQITMFDASTLHSLLHPRKSGKTHHEAQEGALQRGLGKDVTFVAIDFRVHIN